MSTVQNILFVTDRLNIKMLYNNLNDEKEWISNYYSNH
jgi:hypothetical protein